MWAFHKRAASRRIPVIRHAVTPPLLQHLVLLPHPPLPPVWDDPTARKRLYAARPRQATHPEPPHLRHLFARRQPYVHLRLFIPTGRKVPGPQPRPSTHSLASPPTARPPLDGRSRPRLPCQPIRRRRNAPIRQRAHHLLTGRKTYRHPHPVSRPPARMPGVSERHVQPHASWRHPSLPPHPHRHAQCRAATIRDGRVTTFPRHRAKPLAAPPSLGSQHRSVSQTPKGRLPSARPSAPPRLFAIQ
jgi:hypothetical protein